MSKRTLHRVLDECSASVRKSLQGLDNFSAQGTEAFDDLDKLVDKVVDCGKTEVWAREMRQQLRSSKQYLKSDYKVFYFVRLFSMRFGRRISRKSDKHYTQVLQTTFPD